VSSKQHAKGKLTRNDLMLNGWQGREQQAARQRQALGRRPQVRQRARASAVRPSHTAGHAAGRFARGQTGEGFFGNLLGSMLPFRRAE